MAIEPRQPPPQFVAKLQRVLGGRAGWGGFVVQILFVAALAWIAYEIVANARANLRRSGSPPVLPSWQIRLVLTSIRT